MAAPSVGKRRTGAHGRESDAERERRLAPANFGRFELIERIGAGGMAEVFRAAVTGPEGFRRELVIKRVLPELSVRPRFTQMFVNEAKISALLGHPNIVQIFEFGEADGAYFIAMESVRGRTLREVLTKLREQMRTMPVVAAAEITRDVLIALDYAHNLRGADGRLLEIVHRDISPSNIMLADTGAVKVLDFGIARAADLASEDEAKVVKGKIAYVAPEQIACGPIDHRVDLFALGCVLHEMLTGRILFRAKNDLQRKIDLLAEPTTPPSAWNPDVPPALDAVVLRAVERAPDRRYASAAEMLIDIENYLASFRSSSRAVLNLVRSLADEPQPLETTGEIVTARGGDRSSATGTTRPERGLVLARSAAASASSAARISPRPVPAFDLTNPTGHSLSSVTSNHTVSSVRLGGAGSAERDRFTRVRRGRRFMLAARLVAGLGVIAAVSIGGRAFLARRTLAEATASAAGPGGAGEAFVLVTFQSTPAGARIFAAADGKFLGTTPATLPVPPSAHAVGFRFEKDGYRSLVSTTVPLDDRTVTVELKADRRAEKSSRKSSTSKRGARRP